MNTIKKMTAILMLGLMTMGLTSSANTIDSNNVISNLVSLDQESETILSDISAEPAVAPKVRRITPWVFAIPVVVAILATGGLAAAPILGGAVSAEAAFGLALAAAVL